MPLTFQRTFRVRYYECDGYGHLNNANFARYMQEAAFDASASIGYDDARHRELGTMWVVRETHIDFLKAMRYGDNVTVTTWVEDFRRVRSRRRYELTDAAAGDKVAEAWTDWVHVDRASGRPTLTPPEMAAAFMPDGVAEIERERFPDAPPPPSGAHPMRRFIDWRDIDSAGVMNNAAYLTLIEECAVDAARAVGWPMRRIAEEAGVAVVARRLHIEYLAPGRMDDEVIVTTYLDEVRRSTALRHFTVERVRADGARDLLARARALWMFVDIANQKLGRMPQAFAEDFRLSMVGN